MPDVISEVEETFRSPFVDKASFRALLNSSVTDRLAIERYLELPADKRPKLSVYFDIDWYLSNNRDIAEACAAKLCIDPMFHFLKHGLKEKRSPHPLVDLEYIILLDGSAFTADPTDHELVEILNYGLIDPSPYFSLEYYRTQKGVEDVEDEALLKHFLTIGLEEGLRPHPLLDVAWYVEHHPDAPRDPLAALKHFIAVGDREGRRSSPNFDGKWYLQRYPDVALAKSPALKHFIVNGMAEARQAAAEHIQTRAGSPSHASIDPATIRQRYQSFQSEISIERQFKIESVQPEAARLFDLTAYSPDEFDEVFAELRFPASPNPRVSILIPVYNEFRYTVECLLSLQKFAFDEKIEIIIADDASTDPDIRRLNAIENLKVIRQPTNVGFLQNCNAAATEARGDYILLLNNDAQFVDPVAHRLMACLDRDATIGAAGPKIIYPNGRLQEAGCSINAHGQTRMTGLFEDPEAPPYNFERDTHYISGAALMVRQNLLGDALFDKLFKPAYCEDTDLCLRIWASGHRVRYCPDATVAHHLSVSTRKDSEARRLQLVSRNQHRLAEKWKDLLIAMNNVRTIAFYLPQFHPCPENDAWWGRGFTEWTNVSRAQPSYIDHYQPHLPSDLGFYDLRLTEIFGEQAQLAMRYGLSGFCVYYYNFDGRRVLERAFEKLVERPDIPFPYCICWANENWTRHWDGGDRQILLAQNYSSESLDSVVTDAIRYAHDPRYIRVNGKPLFLLYRPRLLPDPPAFAALCRRRFREAGLPEPHLVYVESMELATANVKPKDFGFDACVEFPPQGRAVPSEHLTDIIKEDWAGHRYDYGATAKAFINRPRSDYVRYPAVFPSWDNTPRQPLKGTSFDGTSPELFQAYVEAKLDEVQSMLVGDERLLFVNAWNEWAEGAHLEPDQMLGHRWLEALRDGLRAGESPVK